MRALTIRDSTIVVAEHPDPVPAADDVLIRVRAAGLNGADLQQRAGRYPAPAGSPPDIPGLEAAGEIVAVGDRVEGWSVGDEVMTLVGGGAQAELLASHQRLLLRRPARLSWEQAGGFVEAFATAHDALFSQADLAMGERVCVHGAAGGVGTAAIQLAVAAGAQVVATVRDPQRRPEVEALGATAIDPADAADHGPYDVVLELVGAPNLAANVASLATGGRITVIGVAGGVKAELNLLALMAKRGRIMGSTLRARSLEDRAQVLRGLERHVMPLVDAGRITVPVADRFDLVAQGPAAYDRFEAGGKFGKVVVTVDG